MAALRAIFSRPHPGELAQAPAAAGIYPLAGERRRTDRRHNVLPFASREARLRLAVEGSGRGVYDLDCATGESFWSPEMKAMAGLPGGDGPVSIEQFEDLIDPADRDLLMDCLRASLDPRGDGLFTAEFRLRRPDGGQRRVRAEGRTFFVGEGPARMPLLATGMVTDVTGSRAAQTELVDSRDELAGLVDGAIDAIITIAEDGRILRFNPAACRIFRCPADDAIGSPLDRFIPEAHRAAHGGRIRSFAEGGVTTRTMGLPGVFRGLRADGEEFPFEASIAKVRVGGQWRLTVFLRDITARLAAAEALRQSKEDLELAVRGADIGIWAWDLETGAIEWSDRSYRLFGLSPGEAMNYERFLAAVHPGDRPLVEAAVTATLTTGREFQAECRAVWPDGSIHWVGAIGRDLHADGSGRTVGMRGIAFDIDERKRREESLVGRNEQLESRIEDRNALLVQANAALERSNLELQQFAYVAAHDLQTPLRSIAGFAQLLQKDYRGRLDAQADAWLDQLVGSARRMHDVVQDILSYARVESRGAAFHPTDLGRLVGDVVHTLEAPIRDAGAMVTWEEGLPTVLGDGLQLAQVLQNLIDNGIKYQQGGSPRVHVSARRRDGEWVISVRDNGIGIAPRHREQIFDIFRRLHSQQEYPGTGIGLAICRRVVQRHGGRIWVESEPGQGSVFRFTLPDSQENQP